MNKKDKLYYDLINAHRNHSCNDTLMDTYIYKVLKLVKDYLDFDSLKKENKELKKDYNLLDTTMESDDRIICELLKEKEQLKNDIKLNEAQIDDLTLEVANYKHALEEKNEIIMDLQEEKEELEQQFAYECGCNSQLVDYQTALEIIKCKFVNIQLLINSSCFDDYCMYVIDNELTQQEYELLKEVLKLFK